MSEQNENFENENQVIPEKPKKDKKNRKFYQKKRFWIPMILLFLILALLVTFLIMRSIGKNALTNEAEDVSLMVSDIPDYTVEDDTVVYKGEKYRYNEDLATILCIGTDNEKTKTATPGKAGQADAIFVFTLDTVTGKTTALAIPRDSMAEISLYSNKGNYVGTEKRQICLAYAYGDGKEKSCKNTMDAVSRLLYGIPINSYLAVNMQAVGVVTDKLGGVTVTVDRDLDGQYGVMYHKGQTYTFMGDEALAFLRLRNMQKVDASYNRMNSQLVTFLKAMSSKMISKTKKNISTPINCFNAVKKYTVTDIDTPQITFLTSCFLSGSFNTEVEIKSLTGETKLGEGGYAEFTPDKTETFETILDIFYKKAE